MNSALTDAVAQNNLRHIAQYVRPLLGEAGGALLNKLGPQAKAQASTGYVGLSFCDNECCVVFAQRIDKAAPIQTWEDKYTYEATVPYIAAVSKTFPGRVFSQEVYTLQPQDLEWKGIGEPLSQSFGVNGSNQVNLGLIRHKISEEVVLYCAVPEGLLQDTDFLGILDSKFAYTKNFFLLNLLHAFFLARATRIGDPELPELLGYLRKKLALADDFFKEFLKTQENALEVILIPELRPTDEAEPTVTPVTQDALSAAILKCIGSAKSIVVRERVEGSLRGSPVLAVDITERDDSQPYHAIVKLTDKVTAEREARGLRKLQRYYSKIGMMLPPAQVFWPAKNLPAETPEGLKNGYILVVPDLHGRALSSLAKEQWFDPHVDRCTIFGNYLSQAALFLNHLKLLSETEPGEPLPNAQEPPQERFYSGTSGSFLTLYDDNRFERTRAALADFIGSNQAIINFTVKNVGELYGVNPLWLIEQHNGQNGLDISKREELGWISNGVTNFVTKLKLAHGDFHAGNILVGAEDSRKQNVVVLDFDYVGEHREFDDNAYLEASFVLAVFSASQAEQDDEHWEDLVVDAVRILSGEHPRKALCLEQKRCASDMFRVIKHLRPKIESKSLPNYQASLFCALMRLIRAQHKQYKLAKENLQVGRVATAVLYSSLLLRCLVRPDTGLAQSFNLHPFSHLQKLKSMA